MAIIEPQAVAGANADPEARLVATAVLNTRVEVRPHPRNLGDVELAPVLVHHFFYLYPTSSHFFNTDYVGISD